MLGHSEARARVLRGRRAGREDRADPRPLPGARARRSLIDGEAPARCRSTSCDARGERGRRRRGRRARAAPSGPTTSRRSSTRPARPGRRRAACSRTRTSWPRRGCTAVQLLLDETQPVVYMFLPLAHVLARVAQAVVLDVGGTIVYWGGDPTQIVDELAESQPDTLPRGAADLREDPHGVVVRRRRDGPRLAAHAVRLGAGAGRIVRAATRGRRQLRARLPAPSTGSPTGSCSSKVQTRVRRATARWRVVGAAPIAPRAARVLRRLRRARCSRATA